MTQARYGGTVTVGKREPYPVPKGPVKKAPTIARTGGRVPRAALVAARVSKAAPLVAVVKRARSEDPESSRQRRLGGAIAASGIGGGALAVSGGSDIARDTRSARAGASRLSGRDVGLSRFTPVEGPLLPGKKRRMTFAAMDPPQLTPAERAAMGRLRGAAVVHGRSAGKLGAGLGLLAVGAGLAGRAHTRRWN